MKRLYFLMALLAVLFFLASSLTQAATGPARAQLNAFAQDLHAISGNFSQTFTDPNGKASKTSTGTLVLAAPRQLRWDTLSPYQQTIVADGSRVWLYDPDLEQVTVRRQDTEEAHSPLTVLTDLSQLDKTFRVTEEGEHDGLVWLRLTSTAKGAQFSYADLGFNAHGLVRMQFKDQLGATTDIRFSNWKRNPVILPQTFNFTPPPGADVIGDLPDITILPLKNDSVPK